nr:hypothetical protein [Tanacetum cinerariifolium]
MILKNDGIASKTTKEKVKSLALKAKVTMEQISDDSDSQEGSDEDIVEEVAEAFNLRARNFCKFFRKGNRFGHGNRFDNGANRFERGRKNSFRNKGGESSRNSQGCYNCVEEGHFLNSGFTKHMIRSRRLFTLYKAYNDGHAVFESNQKGKVIGGGSQCNAKNRTRNEVSTTMVLEFLHLDLFGPSLDQITEETPTLK